MEKVDTTNSCYDSNLQYDTDSTKSKEAKIPAEQIYEAIEKKKTFHVVVKAT